MISLENKKVIVTGATGGIGSSVVEKFIEAKATVLATGRNTSKLEELKKKFKNLKTLSFDTSKHEDIEKFINNTTSYQLRQFICEELLKNPMLYDDISVKQVIYWTYETSLEKYVENMKNYIHQYELL